jgi:hypothetical protein
MRLCCPHPFVALVVASTIACQRGPSPGTFRLDVSDDLAKVSIVSREAPLSAILAELQSKHGIDVRLNQDVDPAVTVSIDGVPLDDAVARIVPNGTRYVVRTGAREWSAGGVKNGTKAGAAIEPTPGAIPKGAARPPVSGTTLKRAPDSVVQQPVLEGPRVKRQPTTMLQVGRGVGPKRVNAATQSPAQTLRLRLTMTDNGTIRLDSAVLVEGSPPTAKRVVGPFLYAVRRPDGSLLDFGTFSDPLVEHSFQAEDQRHDERRAREGSFAIAIPGATRDLAPTLAIQIYDARNVTLPTVVDPAAFDAASRRATMMRTVGGQEIARAMQGRRQ